MAILNRLFKTKINWPGTLVNKWVFWSMAVLHTMWAVLFTYDHDATGSTPAFAFNSIPEYLSVPSLLAASALAALGLYRQTKSSLLTFILLAPQHAFVLITAFTSARAVAAEHYADGVGRSFEFILADQGKLLIIAGVYLISYWASHIRALAEAWRQAHDMAANSGGT